MSSTGSQIFYERESDGEWRAYAPVLGVYAWAATPSEATEKIEVMVAQRIRTAVRNERRALHFLVAACFVGAIGWVAAYVWQGRAQTAAAIIHERMSFCTCSTAAEVARMGVLP